jgi:hypothetical protein
MSRKEQESPTRLQKDHQETVNKAFDQTRDNIKRTVNEAKKDVSVYAKQFTDLQEKAIETTMEIAGSSSFW